jgi:orotidine-5'-phosphate decarboxylase
MTSNPIIAAHLKRTGGYQDVNPVILTSGEIGIYYVNTEKLIEDNGEFIDYGDNAGDMYKHAISMMDKNKNFRQIIEILADTAKTLLPHDNAAISGGQRRDWLFSAPVAKLLGVPHISLYKQEDGKEDRIEVHANGGTRQHISIKDFHVVHVADLITEGSSYYTGKDGKVSGWLPMLAQAGAKVKDSLIVATRLQGGEEMLRERGVTAHTFVSIDDTFLQEHSNNPERAVAYFKDPEKWSKEYLSTNGARALAKNFDPCGKNVDRASKFMSRYIGHLLDVGKLHELDDLVAEHYGISARKIATGVTRYAKGDTFADKWDRAVQEKNSNLCIGLDPVEYWQRQDKTLPEGANKLEWCLAYIDKVAEFAAAVKPNRKFMADLSREDRKVLTDHIRARGLVSIDDEKLADIGDTNDSGLYHTWNEGYDAVTYSPFPGNVQEAAVQAHKRGLGLIGMCIMSNPEHKREKNKWVEVAADEESEYNFTDLHLMEGTQHVRQYVQLAKDAAKYNWDGIVIGAPSKKNHITEDEVRRINRYVGPRMKVLMPGIGTQQGEAQLIVDIFGWKNVIANVGSAVMYAKDPVSEAAKYRDMLNSLRK